MKMKRMTRAKSSAPGRSGSPARRRAVSPTEREALARQTWEQLAQAFAQRIPTHLAWLGLLPWGAAGAPRRD